jgi:desampylase
VLLGSAVSIERAVAAANIADDPRRQFLLEPRDHLAARREARALGLDVCGFYHSHPAGDAAPSATDVAEAAYDRCLYLIVGLSAEPAEVRVFRLDDGRFIEARLAVNP